MAKWFKFNNRLWLKDSGWESLDREGFIHPVYFVVEGGRIKPWGNRGAHWSYSVGISVNNCFPIFIHGRGYGFTDRGKAKSCAESLSVYNMESLCPLIDPRGNKILRWYDSSKGFMACIAYDFRNIRISEDFEVTTSFSDFKYQGTSVEDAKTHAEDYVFSRKT